MRFVTGKRQVFEDYGFNTKYWRRGVGEDKDLVLVHLEFAKTLIPNIADKEGFTIYQHKTEAFDKLIKEHFTETLEEDEDEGLTEPKQ